MSDSSFSFSFPSQPPNIRNWFPSYEYESPVLDFSDDTKRISSEETDGEKEENSSFSLSFPSHPPDIRNWFSSYEYVSPGLDLSDDLKCISSEVTDEEKEENLNLGRFKTLKDRCDPGAGKRPSGEGVECEDSNQETQPINTDDQRLLENDEAPVQLKHKLFSEDEILLRVSLRKCNSIPSEDEGDSRKPDKSSPEELNECFAGSGDLAFAKTAAKSRENQEKSLDPLAPTSDCKERVLRRREMKKVDNALPKSGSASKGLDGASREKLHSSRDEEGEYFTKDGFISTNNQENRKERPGSFAMKPMPRMKCGNQMTGKQLATTTCELTLSEYEEKSREMCTGNAGVGLQAINRKLVSDDPAQVRRVALSERTNSLAEVSPIIPGKWQCPRKNKANLGPPMKQLRLEHWVRRAI